MKRTQSLPSFHRPRQQGATTWHERHSQAAGTLAVATTPARHPPVPQAPWRGVGAQLARCLGLAPPARLLQANSLQEALRCGIIDAHTFVALDLDDTLIAHAPDDTLPRPVEPTTARWVRALQDVGVPVFGLTSRAPAYRHCHIARRTARELRACGINLAYRTCLPGAPGLPLRWPGAFWGGIAFCGYNGKGEVAALAARWLGISRLAVVDDNLDHFASLIRARSRPPVELTLVHYTAAMSDAQRALAAPHWRCLKLRQGWW